MDMTEHAWHLTANLSVSLEPTTESLSIPKTTTASQSPISSKTPLSFAFFGKRFTLLYLRFGTQTVTGEKKQSPKHYSDNMAVVKEFLFVNSGNKSSAGHKISTTGRAFVIRKARAAQPWSTKSKAGRKRAPFGSDDSPNATASSNSSGSDSPDGAPATNTLFDGKHSAGIAEEVPVAVAPQRIQDDGNPKPKRGKGGVSKRQRPTAGVKPGQSKPASSNSRFGGKFQEHHANNIFDHVECVHCGYAVGLCICQAGATLVSQAQTLSGRLDPFGTVSVRMGQRDTDLLAYCK